MTLHITTLNAGGATYGVSSISSASAVNTTYPIYNGGAGRAGSARQVLTNNGWTWATTPPSLTPLRIHGKDNNEIVRLNEDGTVVWGDGIKVDEAVEAFGEVLKLNLENNSGLTHAVKQRMRDTVFEEIISMARDKGSLTVDDLTYLHQAAKIMDKLKAKT